MDLGFQAVIFLKGMTVNQPNHRQLWSSWVISLRFNGSFMKHANIKFVQTFTLFGACCNKINKQVSLFCGWTVYGRENQMLNLLYIIF